MKEKKSRNERYWEKRVANETWTVYNSLEEKNRKLLDFYIDASESVKEELYQLAEKFSKDGVLSLSEMHKRNRLTELNKKFEKIIEKLGHSVEDFSKENMQEGFQKVYESVAAGMGDVDFAMPNKKLMEKLMDTPWRGDSFSGRLWKNQKKLAVSLNDLLLVGLQQGKTATEIAVMLHNRMGQGFNECHRLVRTETMHYLNDATLQRYKDADVRYVQVWAALDERTCPSCGSYHGRTYPIEKCPPIPFHANCRCVILPVILEKEEEGAIIKYISPDSYVLNDKLRRNELLTSEEKTWIMHLNRALNKLPEYEGNLNRSVIFYSDGEAKKYFDEFIVNQEYIPIQYLSTTRGNVYDNEASVQIYIQNAKHGKDLSGLNDMKKEVMYLPNSRFKVLNKMEKDGKYYILLEEI